MLNKANYRALALLILCPLFQCNFDIPAAAATRPHVIGLAHRPATLRSRVSGFFHFFFIGANSTMLTCALAVLLVELEHDAVAEQHEV
jgi:hypothetical protein